MQTKQSSVMSDMDELRSLAPNWIRVSRRAVPDPLDKRLTQHEYYLHDEDADKQLLALKHRSGKALRCFVAHTLSAISELGIDILPLPKSLRIDMSYVNGTKEHIVLLLDPDRKECLLYVSDRDPLRAVVRFWAHPVLPAAIAPIAA